MITPAEVTSLVERARSLGARIVAIELQWDLDENDDGLHWMLLVCAIVAAPGPVSSGYRSVPLTEIRAE
jgi:hypothetical protein